SRAPSIRPRGAATRSCRVCPAVWRDMLTARFPGGGLMSHARLELGPEPLTVLPDALRRLGLTTLAVALPQLLETARAQQWTYDLFLQQAVGAEVQGRAQRA